MSVPWHPGLPDADECRRRFDRLQPRQQQVIGLLARGWAPKQIAVELGIAVKTVYVHLTVASEALEVHPPQPAVIALFHRAAEAGTVVEAHGRWLVTELRNLVDSDQVAS